MPKFKTISSIILLALIFVGGSCRTGKEAVVNEVSSQTNGVTSDNFAPNFSLESRDGQLISLSDYRGEKPVILDFWASWCSNCQRSMPIISELYRQYSNDIEIIGVNMSERNFTVDRFVKNNDIRFPIVVDSDKTLTKAYGVMYTNWHVMINRQGEWVANIPGDLSEADIKQLIAL